MRSGKISLFLLFADLRKAFDSVARQFLTQVLLKRCPEALASILSSLHEKAKLFFEGTATETESGVLQGDTLAAIIFVWVMDEVMREWEKRKKRKWGIRVVFKKGDTLKEFLPHDWHTASAEIFELLLNWLGFADDMLFLSTNLAEILEAFELFCEICLSVGLEVNFDKCGLLSMQWNGLSLPKELPVRGKKLPVVQSYQYLGVLVTTQGTFFEHVEERSRRALGVVLGRVKNVESWIGNDSFLLLKQLSGCFAPCLTWGTEVITLKKEETSSLDVTFFKFLRRVFKVEFDEKNKKWEKTNKELSDLAEMEQPSELLPLARLRFFFHLFEKETTYPPECFLNGKMDIEE